MKKYFFIPLFVFLVVSIVYCFPIFKNFSYWGQMDWDQFTFWNAVPRETILRYHQFPLWNPYANGGNVLLAHPHSPFLSPFYVFVLIFGPVTGLKLQIIIHLFLGLWGMYCLAKHLKIGGAAAYLTSFIFMLCSVYPLHITEGHAEWFAYGYVPWAFLFYLKSFNKPRSIFAAIFFLGLMIFTGVYIFNIFVIFLSVYALCLTVQKRKALYLKMLALLYAGAFLLCAVKLIPELEFLIRNPRIVYESGGTGAGSLSRMLFGRGQMLWDINTQDHSFMFGLENGWHEYGAYIGIIPFCLFILGLVRGFKKTWPLFAAGIFCLLIVLGDKSPFNLWGAVRLLPVYRSLSSPSRFIAGFIFSAALMAGYGLQGLQNMLSGPLKGKSNNPVKALSAVVVLFVLADLTGVNSVIFNNAFRIVPMKVTREDTFRQRYYFINFFHPRLSRSSQYPIFLSNSGIIGAYECVSVDPGNLFSSDDKGYMGEAYLAGSKGAVSTVSFSPNKIIIDADVSGKDTLVLNQNYYTGWKVKEDGHVYAARPFRGLISAPVSSGRHRVTFYFLPAGFIAGLAVSLAFILISVYWLYFKKDPSYNG